MKDLWLAKKVLQEQDFTLVITKADKVLYSNDESGIIPLVKALENLGDEMKDASLADKIVGKAGAMLCLFAGVKNVWAETISESGKKTFQKAGKKVVFEIVVPRILNRKKNDLCPFEKLTITCKKPEEAHKKIKNFLDKKGKRAIHDALGLYD